LYGTTASNIGVNSTNPHIPQLSQSNHSILNANYPQTAAQPQFPSYSYPHSYQASGISYPPIVSAANLASMYTPSTYSNYIHQNLHQTGNSNLSKSTVSLTSTTNSTKESLVSKSQHIITLEQKNVFNIYYKKNYDSLYFIFFWKLTSLSNNNISIFEHLVN